MIFKFKKIKLKVNPVTEECNPECFEEEEEEEDESTQSFNASYLSINNNTNTTSNKQHLNTVLNNKTSQEKSLYQTPEELANSNAAKKEKSKTPQKGVQNSLNQTPQLFLDKPIGDLKFETNCDLVSGLKQACNSYNNSMTSEVNNKEEEACENDHQPSESMDEGQVEFFDQEASVNNNHDTFLSCNSFLNSFNKNGSRVDDGYCNLLN